MIRKPFRTPLLKVTEDQGENDRVSEPQSKRRRINSDEGDGGDVVKTTGPQLVFKNAEISRLPRKPPLVVNNAVSLKSLDGDFEEYYNVLWYVLQN